MQTRIPPQALDAEKALLGAIMLKPDCLYDVSDNISADSFYVEKHRVLYRAMMDLFTKSEPIDALTVSARLSSTKDLERVGGATYLTELVNSTPATANALHYANLVAKASTLRNLINAAEYIAELGYDEANDMEHVLDEAEKRLYEITNAPSLHKFVSMQESLGEAWERIDRLHKTSDELRGVPTGYKELDNLLAGFQRSDLIILAARPSMGKTSLALDIARQTAIQQGVTVGIFSLEMSAQQLVDRMLAAEARVDAWKLRTGKLSTDEDFSRVRDAIDRLSQAPIFVDDKPANNILAMRSVARRLKREHNLGLVIVDYLQMMAPTHSRATDNLVQQTTEISRSLKTLARELDVPVIALSQLSRAVEQRRGKPRLSDLRDSGCLTGDTLLMDARDGSRHTIRELAERANVGELQIAGVDHTHKIAAHAVTRVFYSGKKEVFRLSTRSGRSIKASANHKFLTLSGWKRLDTLVAGDHIAVPRALTVNPASSSLTNEELILLAHLLGDGCILPKQPYHYTSADMANIEHVRETAHTLFGITGRLVAQRNWYHLYLPSPHKLAHGKVHPITAWFERLGIERVRSYEKRIPEAVMECGQAQIALFLRHLWSTDGNMSWKRSAGRKPAAAIYYASSSEKLAQGVQHLLLRLGIQGTLRVQKSAKGYRPMYHVTVVGTPHQRAFLEQIGTADSRVACIEPMLAALSEITPNTNVDTIPREAWRLVIEPAKAEAHMSWRDVQRKLGHSYNGSALLSTSIGRSRMQAMAALLDSDACLSLATSDVLWDKIVAIDKLGVEDVYDATVPDVHNFVANDILVHNSIEQDADVVMFIHREDKMNETSDRPNIAEILVEKHRNGPTGSVELYFDDKKTSFLSIEKSSFSAMPGGVKAADEEW